MRILKSESSIKICSWEELAPYDQRLFDLAIRVREHAQAPYSHYKVGCAVTAGPYEVFTGVNVERNSWTQTTHAEQNAIDNAVSRLGSTRIKKVAVVGAPEGEPILLKPSDPNKAIERVDQVCPSCGHCLQIILENCFDLNGDYDPNVELLGTANGEFYITTIGSALPMPFLPKYLGINYAEIRNSIKNNRE